jgi:POT family proton-dependent oligopeptide transporter
MAKEYPPEEARVAAATTDLPPSEVHGGTGGFFGHPKGLSTLFFTEMWERFSFYGIRPLLILFMTAALVDGGFGFERETASSIVGIYALSVYLASLPGGWVADRLLGLRRSIYYGGILIACGHIAIGLSAFLPMQFFFLGLVLIVMGTGMLKPNVSAIVGDLYPEGGSRRDAGFSVFYMGINTGAFIAPLITGALGEKVGYHWGFGAAGLGMIIGVIWFRMREGPTLGSLGLAPRLDPDPVKQEAALRRAKLYVGAGVAVLAVVVLSAMLGLYHIDAVSLAHNIVKVILAMALLYFIYLLAFAGLNSEERKRTLLIIVLFVFATIFWSAFEQAPTSLTLFARDYTNRTLFGWEMPATWFQAINSLFVILLAPVFAVLWTRLGAKGRDLSSPAKFAFGLFFAGLGFMIMIFAANEVISGVAKVSMWWLIMSYILQTFGELSLSPVGLSSMTKLAPTRFKGQMMGVWFMAAALGNLIAGIVGGQVDPEKLDQMPKLFLQTTMSLFIAAVVLALMIVPIRRMMANTTEQ